MWKNKKIELIHKISEIFSRKKTLDIQKAQLSKLDFALYGRSRRFIGMGKALVFIFKPSLTSPPRVCQVDKLIYICLEAWKIGGRS